MEINRLFGKFRQKNLKKTLLKAKQIIPWPIDKRAYLCSVVDWLEDPFESAGGY